MITRDGLDTTNTTARPFIPPETDAAFTVRDNSKINISGHFFVLLCKTQHNAATMNLSDGSDDH